MSDIHIVIVILFISLNCKWILSIKYMEMILGLMITRCLAYILVCNKPLLVKYEL